jgi:hypothetical protein
VEEQIPSWAQELIREIAVLNERLPDHIEWSLRNIEDHENRIRTLEQFRWMIVGIVSLAGVLGGIIAKFIN